jgi:hypothetical protein
MNYKVSSFEWGSIDPNEVLKKQDSKNGELKTYHLTVNN